jgi:hypothetical protein
VWYSLRRNGHPLAVEDRRRLGLRHIDHADIETNASDSETNASITNITDIATNGFATNSQCGAEHRKCASLAVEQSIEEPFGSNASSRIPLSVRDWRR